MNNKANRILFKVCGLANSHDIVNCISAGADALGFLLGENNDGSSPDKLSIAAAKELIRHVPAGINSVLLTKETDAEKIRQQFQAAAPVSLQLQNADLSVESIVQLRRLLPEAILIRTIRVKQHTDVNQIGEMLTRLSTSINAVLLDAERGGSGQTIDWNISAQIGEKAKELGLQLVLAGGLNEGNVQEAVAMVRPDMVDIMSGVSISRGVKDITKVGNIRKTLDRMN